MTPQHGQVSLQGSCCRSFVPSAPTCWWGHFLAFVDPSKLQCLHPLPSTYFIQYEMTFPYWNLIYVLLTNRPSKSSLKKMKWKSEGFSQMVVGSRGWTKESARFLLFGCPCLSSPLVNPFPFSRLILPAGDWTQKLLLGLLGEWEGLDSTELSKCLIATNFNRICPKYSLEDTYQREILLKGFSLYLSW